MLLNKKLILGAVGAGFVVAAIASMTSPSQAQSDIDPQAFEAAMEAYIEANPRFLERLSNNLNTIMIADQAELNKSLIAQNADALFNAEDAIVIGNPDGAVTMVEFFDFNCHYCRAAAPTVASALAKNSDLRIVLMDLPILTAGSIEAAEIGIAFAQLGGNIEAFHEDMWILPGEANAESALAVAEKHGADREELLEKAKSDEVKKAVQRRIDLAQAMQVSGTPSFIIGDQIAPGAIPEATMQGLIDAAR